MWKERRRYRRYPVDILRLQLELLMGVLSRLGIPPPGILPPRKQRNRIKYTLLSKQR